MSGFLDIWISSTGQCFVHFSGTNISRTKNSQIIAIYNFLLHSMRSFDCKQKNQDISKKFFFTDRKNDDVTFSAMVGVKILPTSIFFNFGNLKSHWNNKKNAFSKYRQTGRHKGLKFLNISLWHFFSEWARNSKFYGYYVWGKSKPVK